MNKTVIKWTFFAPILWSMTLLSSCVYVPPVWDASDPIYSIDSIKPGVTTKDELLQKFGEPQWKDPYYSPVKYIYSGHKSHGAMLYIIPFIDEIRLQQVGQEGWKVVIHFDENDVVDSISISEKNSKYDHSPSKWGQDKVNVEWLKSKEANTYCPNADLGHADAQLHIADLLY